MLERKTFSSFVILNRIDEKKKKKGTYNHSNNFSIPKFRLCKKIYLAKSATKKKKSCS